jgi:hypothetical protein
MIVFEENTHPLSWEIVPPTPMMIRIMILPTHMGDEPTDNDHGEEMALTFMEEAIPKDAATIMVTDSMAARSKYMPLRDGNYHSQRQLLRKIHTGISKCITIRMQNEIQEHKNIQNTTNAESIAKLAEMMTALKKQIGNKKNKL